MTDNVYGFHNTDLGHAVDPAGSSQTSNTLKRSLDLFGAVCGLLLLTPLFVILAAAIKVTSKGPVLFKQNRHGLDGKTFKAYKFRSMYVDQCDQSGVRQTVKDDPRITPIGRFLRKSNFDELPQLLNVLKGEMSLVGPRPHVPGMLANGLPYEQFDPRYQLRHRVKPGITGLAQVNGFRGETKTAHAASMRLYYDLKYIEVRSIFLDVKIIVSTVIQEFFGGKGY
ncbi:exopolysaccharide biosynthesis polyprenyl glycosylphosphotransferase [Roseibium sp.]|uniref:exopolysaccharide biosynthesis polyprenyl glycosylphosphotransferase n=1 Tax=Roseibium sp. TaxID=1936156 RepID=UPI003BAB4E2A